MALKEKRPQITKKYYLRKSEKQHNPGIDPTSPALQADFYHWSTREALKEYNNYFKSTSV